MRVIKINNYYYQCQSTSKQINCKFLVMKLTIWHSWFTRRQLEILHCSAPVPWMLSFNSAFQNWTCQNNLIIFRWLLQMQVSFSWIGRTQPHCLLLLQAGLINSEGPKVSFHWSHVNRWHELDKKSLFNTEVMEMRHLCINPL